MPMPLLLPALGALALLGLAASGGKKSPSGLPPGVTPPTTPPPDAQVLPDSVQKELAKAVASMNPQAMMAYANEVAKKYPYAADQLRKAAGQVAMTGKAPKPVWTPPAAPAATVSTSAAPSTPAAVPYSAPSGGSTYVVKSGDTGQKIALAFTGDKNRWKELLTVNPKLKDAKYGIRLYAGQTINIPSGWGSGASASSGPSASEDASIRAQIYQATDPATLDALASALNSKPGYQSLGALASQRAAELRAMGATATGVQQVQQILSAPASASGGSTYVVKSGDTGEKLALAFTGDKKRWPELAAANPKLKDPKYGIRLYAGKTINLPASWQTPVDAAPAPAPLPPPVITTAAPASPSSPSSPSVSPLSDLQLKTDAVATYIKGSRKGSEDTLMIKNWQTAAGLPQADGKFGPSSAERMAELGVSVLPIVWYWPKANAASRVVTYKKRLNELAAQADAAGNSDRATALRASAARDNGQSRQTAE